MDYTVKQLILDLDESERISLKDEIARKKPVRLPNPDWDENDPRELIDFPCSNTFLDYYHHRGYTPRQSENYRGQRPDFKYYQLNKGGTAHGKAGGVQM